MLSRSSHLDEWVLPTVLLGSGTLRAETTLPLRPPSDGAAVRTTVGAFIVDADAVLPAMLLATDPWTDGAGAPECLEGAPDLWLRAET